MWRTKLFFLLSFIVVDASCFLSRFLNKAVKRGFTLKPSIKLDLVEKQLEIFWMWMAKHMCKPLKIYS